MILSVMSSFLWSHTKVQFQVLFERNNAEDVRAFLDHPYISLLLSFLEMLSIKGELSFKARLFESFFS